MPVVQVDGNSDVWTQGFGCIQVCAAYEYLKQHWECSDEHVPIIVKCGEGGRNQGVFIREQSDLASSIVRDVNVRAFFPPESPPDPPFVYLTWFSLSKNHTAPSMIEML